MIKKICYYGKKLYGFLSKASNLAQSRNGSNSVPEGIKYSIQFEKNMLFMITFLN
jgi:hypothetical protein